MLLVVLGAALALASGCGDSAFESNDYTMTFLTSQTLGKQLKNSSGRATDRTASGLLRAAVAIDEMRLADDRQDQAMELYGAGEYELAGDVLDEAIKLRPDDISYRTDRALVALADGDTDGAFVQWEEQDRIAELNGWDKTEDYWNRQMADSRSIIVDINQHWGEDGRMGNTLPEYGAALIRHADILDQVADFREATGEASNLVEHTRNEADSNRRRGNSILDE
jgi:tetratricopeptide (TPR) repeat protein